MSGLPWQTRSDELSHIPVLYQEVLSGLQIEPGRRYIDGTVGGGGHAYGILMASAPNGELLGIDADPAAVAAANDRLAEFGSRVTLVQGSFADLEDTARQHGFGSVDGILLDLGLSSLQLEVAGRGFSFQLDGSLDMRFDPSRTTTAADLVNDLPQEELASILFKYGEEPRARRIARSIVAERPISTTGELAALVGRAVGHKKRIHPATRTFQALRMAVNEELECLSKALPQAVRLLASGGRMAIISFHSLEDRLVKQFFRREAQDCLCAPEVLICACGHQAALGIVTKKPIGPSAEEVATNPRSRSAKLRVAYRLSEGDR